MAKDMILLLVFMAFFSFTNVVNGMGIITISMDDGYDEQYKYAYPILSNRSINATIFVSTNHIVSSNNKKKSVYLTVPQLTELQNAGWEIASYTKTQPDLTALNDYELENEIKGSKEYLIANGFVPQTFSYPFGRYNDYVTHKVKEHFVIARNTAGGINNHSSSNILTVNLNGRNVGINSDMVIKSWIDQAISNDQWLHIYFHQIDSSGYINYSETESGTNLIDIADYIKLKVDAGQLKSLNFIQGWYETKKVSSTISITTPVHNTSIIDFDLRQDVLENPQLILYGITYDNLVLNPSFEDLDSGIPKEWEYASGIINVTSSNDSVYGKYSAEMAMNLSSTESYIYQTYTLDYLNLHGGDDYVYIIRVKNVSNISLIKSAVYYLTENEGYISGNSTYSKLSTNYETIITRGKIPETTSKIRLVILVPKVDDSSSFGILRVDGISFTKSNSIPDTFFEGNNNSIDVNITIGNSIYAERSLLNNEKITLNLLDNYGTIKTSIDGHGLVYLTLKGDRIFNVQYGWVEYDKYIKSYTITEYYQNYTQIEFWKNASINLLNNINYRIRPNVGGTIGTLSLTPIGGSIQVTVVKWDTSDDYQKIWRESPIEAGVSTKYTIGGFPANKTIVIKRDGIDWKAILSNSTGHISFTNSGGYSKVFETYISNSPNTLMLLDDSSGILNNSSHTASTPKYGLGIVVIILSIYIILWSFIQRKQDGEK